MQFTHEAETCSKRCAPGELVPLNPLWPCCSDSRDQISRLLAELSDAEPSHDTDALGLGWSRACARCVARPTPAAAPTLAPCWRLRLNQPTRMPHRAGICPSAWARCAAQRPDPLASCATLAKLGDASRIRCCPRPFLRWTAWMPRPRHIGFELRLLSDSTSREELASVFEFALDDCDLRILPPGSAPADFEDRAQHRCGDVAEARTAPLPAGEALACAFRCASSRPPHRMPQTTMPLPSYPIERRDPRRAQQPQ